MNKFKAAAEAYKSVFGLKVSEPVRREKMNETKPQHGSQSKLSPLKVSEAALACLGPAVLGAEPLLAPAEAAFSAALEADAPLVAQVRA